MLAVAKAKVNGAIRVFGAGLSGWMGAEMKANENPTHSAEPRGNGECTQPVPAAQSREGIATDQAVIAIAPEEQLALWAMLAAPAKLTAAQEKLVRVMRGEAPLNPPC